MGTGSSLTAKKISNHQLKLKKVPWGNAQQYIDHDLLNFRVERSSTCSGQNRSSGTGETNHFVDEDTDGGRIAS